MMWCPKGSDDANGSTFRRRSSPCKCCCVWFCLVELKIGEEWRRVSWKGRRSESKSSERKTTSPRKSSWFLWAWKIRELRTALASFQTKMKSLCNDDVFQMKGLVVLELLKRKKKVPSLGFATRKVRKGPMTTAEKKFCAGSELLLSFWIVDVRLFIHWVRGGKLFELPTYS